MADRAASDVPDWQPTLAGGDVRLRPLRADDLEPLYAAASDPAIWEQHPARTRHERGEFERFFAAALACGTALAAQSMALGRLVGMSRYYEWTPAERSVVVGYTWLERAVWGNGFNRTMKQLMLGHAFRWADVVLFHVGRDNLRSQRALERLGARRHGERLLTPGDLSSHRLVYAIRPGDLGGARD